MIRRHPSADPGRLGRATAALVTLLAVAAIPAALAVLVGWPLPNRVPSTGDLVAWVTQPISSHAVVDILTVIVWAAWAHFMTCMAAELINATLRRGRTQLRVPLGGISQGTARQLVTALLLAGASVPLVATPAAAAAEAWATPVIAATSFAASPVSDPAGLSRPGGRQKAPASDQQNARAPAADADDTLRTYTVAAPAAGRYDCLWDIAERHLGDGTRWAEIHQLNVGRPQPDGAALQDPDLIRPGWQLWMPADATNLPPSTPTDAAAAPQAPSDRAADPAVHVVSQGDTLWDIAADELGAGHRYDELADAATGLVQPDGAHLVDPDLIRPGWVIPLPADPSNATTPTAAGSESTAPVPEQGPANPSPSIESGRIEAGRVEAESSQAPPTPAATPTGTPTATAPADVRSSSDQPVSADETGSTLWMLAGLTGAGTVLAGSMLLLLHQRRRSQFRARRPGRSIAVVPPELAAVEKSVIVSGSGSAPTVEFMDLVLRRLAAAQAGRGQPMPDLAAVALTSTGLVLHLSAPSDLPPPWDGSPDSMRWACGGDVDADLVGPHVPDQPAPYPLLVTVGASDSGEVWLANCEQMGALTIAGDTTRGRALARYLTAELACNPWSHGVRVDCVGVAEEVAPMNPDRVRFHRLGADPAADILADAVAVLDRADQARCDVASARATGQGDDAWPARVLLVEAGEEETTALAQLLRLVGDHPGRTGTAVVVTGGRKNAPGTALHVSSDGRLTLPGAGLDLVAVGLSSEEARGCAALYAHSEDLQDAAIPCDPDATDGWRSYANEAGALREEHTVPRHAQPQEIGEPAGSVLAHPDQEYLAVAATTGEDLQALAPKVPTRVRSAVQDADPTLDDDVDAWFSQDCPLPRLSLLGPVGARTRGMAITKRKPYYTELLTFLATRPHGATPDEVADAFGITATKARDYVKTVREWLGVNPRTGQMHVPDARKSPAAQARGVGVYQVEGLLVDIDLFRRLRLRGQARGADGLADLRRALTLVTGKPFDKLRAGGWAWLAEGDRIDQHMLCATVDVAHLVTTRCLRGGDLAGARTVAEMAALAAPDEEIPRLDLAAVAAAQGHHQAAEEILRDEVCNRADDGGPPTELPERTRRVIDSRGWLARDKTAS